MNFFVNGVEYELLNVFSDLTFGWLKETCRFGRFALYILLRLLSYIKLLLLLLVHYTVPLGLQKILFVIFKRLIHFNILYNIKKSK